MWYEVLLLFSDNLLCTLDFQLNEFVNIKLYNNNYTLRNFNLFVYMILYFLQFIDSVCKIPVGEDLSFAKKSMVAKRNRYKEKFPCKLLCNILCYNHMYDVERCVPPEFFHSTKITLLQLSLLFCLHAVILHCTYILEFY